MLLCFLFITELGFLLVPFDSLVNLNKLSIKSPQPLENVTSTLMDDEKREAKEVVEEKMLFNKDGSTKKGKNASTMGNQTMEHRTVKYKQLMYSKIKSRRRRVAI